MKNKITVMIIMILLVAGAFFSAGYITEQKHKDDREERCKTLILFALDKTENEDLKDEGVMRALISNVYAAYQFCDEEKSAKQLHDLWNYLIFESKDREQAKDIASRELNAVLQSVMMPEE